jgi:hypothetical protein
MGLRAIRQICTHTAIAVKYTPVELTVWGFYPIGQCRLKCELTSVWPRNEVGTWHWNLCTFASKHPIQPRGKNIAYTTDRSKSEDCNVQPKMIGAGTGFRRTNLPLTSTLEPWLPYGSSADWGGGDSCGHAWRSRISTCSRPPSAAPTAALPD